MCLDGLHSTSQTKLIPSYVLLEPRLQRDEFSTDVNSRHVFRTTKVQTNHRGMQTIKAIWNAKIVAFS